MNNVINTNPHKLVVRQSFRCPTTSIVKLSCSPVLAAVRTYGGIVYVPYVHKYEYGGPSGLQYMYGFEVTT